MNELLLQIIVDLVNGHLVEWLTFLVLFATLGFVAYYTFVTNKLQKTSEQQINELIRQRRLSKMPSIITDIDLFETDGLKPGFFVPELNLLNVGNGLAIGIKLENISISFEPEIANDSVEIKFLELDFLRKTQTKTITGQYVGPPPQSIKNGINYWLFSRYIECN